ncbi:phage tail protein [Salipiger sp. IMCC34102]|nr:phage tail protein [Salipiger sp. IMCC34102]
MAVSAFSYRSSEGDVLDDVVFRHYGSRDGRELELVLEANPGIAAVAERLPIGTVVLLPTIVSAPERREVSLWD